MYGRTRVRKVRIRELAVSDEYHKKEKEAMKTTTVFILALVAAGLNIFHVSTMHENYRHFSHLSTLEREMSFRTEMGLYFSYYKRIVEAPSLTDGLYHMMNDNLVEYPDRINAVKRFNLYPEIVVGTMFRLYRLGVEKWALPGEQCWPVDRGNNLPPVTSCEGIGEPTYFYLYFVWFCSGLTAAIIFLFGYTISNSIIGGLMATLSFFFNHGEATRVQWTPPLRESFAYPVCLAQMLAVARTLSLFQWKNVYHRRAAERPSSAVQVWRITLLTWMSLVAWQFSQFVLCTQTLAVYLMYSIGLIDKRTLLLVLRGLMLGLCLAVICLFGNKFLVCSLLTCLLLTIIMAVKYGKIDILVNDHRIGIGSVFSRTMCFLQAFVGAIAIKIIVNHIFGMDDAHIFNIFRAKLTGYKDFHTMLYTCAAEFDFLPWEVIINLFQTLLLPAVVVAAVTVFWNWYYQWNYKCHGDSRRTWKEMIETLDADVVYTLIQLCAFGIMALLVMRLKLFFTPHLCVLTSLLASKKYYSCLKTEVYWSVLAVIVGIMSIKGSSNIQIQRNIRGEYSNVPMEQLMMWIDTETAPTAVFAGPMSVMANIVLSTRRPVVNHPHYEDTEVRERTKKVYALFGRRPAWQVFELLSGMGVEYVVLEEAWCLPKNRAGCSILKIWDTVERKLPWEPVCPTLFHGNPHPFERVFTNGVYVILKVNRHDQEPLSYVELVTPKEYVM